MSEILDSIDKRTGEYADFFTRAGAYIIDGLLVGVVNYVIGLIIGFVLPASMAAIIGGVIGLLIGVGYFAYMESSEKQATFGKQALGLIVTDMDGGRISMSTAVIRYLAKILSAIILLIGFIMVFFTEKKQGLHDILAKTLVIKK